MQLHDTHFHLDLFENPNQIITTVEQARVYTIAVTNLPELYDNTNNLTASTRYFRAALGFHPELAAQHKKQLDLFKKKIGLTRYIGEVGLDNCNKTPADYSEQKKIFEKIIETSHEAGKKILTVHSRRSEKDVISIIGPKFSGKVILHWYSGSLKELEKAVEYGFYFSVNFAMSQSENGKKIIERVPSNKLLIETDGPFVMINGRQSTPTDVGVIAQILFSQKKASIGSEITDVFLTENFKNLLN